MLGANKAFTDMEKYRHIHLMGIGGAGMSGLALLLNSMGHEISGCDMVDTFYLNRVRDCGAGIAIGHNKDHLDHFKPDLIIHSSAIAMDHPELVEARHRGITVAHRADILSLIFNSRLGVGVAGTHGKTTTSSMISLIAERAKLNPTVAIGGELYDIGCNAKLGVGEYMVAELDESDGSFELFSPAISIITNIDWDHVDHYPSFKAVLDAFERFADGRKPSASLVVCAEDPGVESLLSSGKYEGSTTYGWGIGWSWGAGDLRHIQGGGVVYTAYKDGKSVGDVTLRVSGEHNVLNSLAAIAASDIMGVPFATAVEALGVFRGAKRRLQPVGIGREVIVYDDYGHHPREITATLAALEKMFPDRGLHVVFQPHRYSRTEALYNDFALALCPAKRAYLLPIYPADEKPINGVSSFLIAEALNKLGRENVVVCGDFQEAANLVSANVRSGDMVLTIGAGSVEVLGRQILDSINSMIPVKDDAAVGA